MTLGHSLSTRGQGTVLPEHDSLNSVSMYIDDDVIRNTDLCSTTLEQIMPYECRDTYIWGGLWEYKDYRF